MKDVVDRSTSAMTDVRRVDAIASAEKTARLRAAVEEAKVEIAAYRAEREARYAAMVNEVRDETSERRGDETKHKILTASFSSISKLEIKWRWMLVSKRSSTPRCPRFTLESTRPRRVSSRTWSPP